MADVRVKRAIQTLAVHLRPAFFVPKTSAERITERYFDRKSIRLTRGDASAKIPRQPRGMLNPAHQTLDAWAFVQPDHAAALSQAPAGTLLIAMDTLTQAERSARMGRVRGKDTKPELKVRRLVHALGYRYRLHRRELPGTPDLVFGPRRRVIFIHGCFWHRHVCELGRLPKSRLDFWLPKLEANRRRDEANLALLTASGWSALVIWECQLGDSGGVRDRIKGFLDA